MSSKKLLMITFISPHKSSRLSRHVEFFSSKGFKVDVLCNEEVKHPLVNKGFKFGQPELSFVGRILRMLARILRAVIPINVTKHYLTEKFILRFFSPECLASEYDVVLAEHVVFLRWALKTKSEKTKVVVDVKDYFPRSMGNMPFFRFFDGPYYHIAFSDLLGHADLIISVSDGLRDLLRKDYGYDSVVLPNATRYHDIVPNPVSNTIKFVHVGWAINDRGIEEILSCNSFSNERTLDLYLGGDDAYIDKLRVSVADNEYVTFHEFVPIDQVIPTINRYDVALICFPKGNINNYLSLPNKFYEAVQARLMVVTTPLPEMAAIVKKYDLGGVLPSFEISDLDECLQSLTPEKVAHYKKAVGTAAVHLSFEVVAKKLEKSLDSII